MNCSGCDSSVMAVQENKACLLGALQTTETTPREGVNKIVGLRVKWFLMVGLKFSAIPFIWVK